MSGKTDMEMIIVRKPEIAAPDIYTYYGDMAGVGDIYTYYGDMAGVDIKIQRPVYLSDRRKTAKPLRAVADVKKEQRPVYLSEH